MIQNDSFLSILKKGKLPCAILKCYQTLMMGMDRHDTLNPAQPIPFLPPPISHPHFVCALLPWSAMDQKYTFTVLSSGCGVILRGADAGSFIPHVGFPPIVVNPLLPIIIATSGSKSEFGVFSVMMEKEPVAAAFPLVFVTMNVNCAGPLTSKKASVVGKLTKGMTAPPSLTNIVIAPNTHFVGMGVGDIVASVVQIALDIVIQMAINFGCGKLGNYISGNLLPRMFAESIAQGVASPGMLAAIVNPRSANAIGNLVGFFTGDFILGSPIGYSGALPGADDGTLLGAATADDHRGNQGGIINSTLTEGIANPLNNYFYGSESM